MQLPLRTYLIFDSTHGRWHLEAKAERHDIFIEGKKITVSQNKNIKDSNWSACDIVIEASGVMRDSAKLQAYFEQGVKKVLLTAPMKVK